MASADKNEWLVGEKLKVGTAYVASENVLRCEDEPGIQMALTKGVGVCRAFCFLCLLAKTGNLMFLIESFLQKESWSWR